jgi:phosphohistidine phosphatase
MTATHRLYLLRHAKSSWKDSELADHDRPLAGRGRRAAKAIARHLDEHDVEVELVLCSTARRARETLERIEPALGNASLHYERELYGATANGLLERLRSVSDDVATVMLIGHNPALEDLARELGRPASELEPKFPTAALATLELTVAAWGDLAPGGARLTGVVRPRDLQ